MILALRSTRMAAFGRQFGVAQVEAYAQLARGVEQRLHVGVGHAFFKVALDGLGVFHPVARKERGQRQLGKNDKLRAAGGGLAHHFDQAADHGRAGIGKVHSAHLGDRQAHLAGGVCITHDVDLQAEGASMHARAEIRNRCGDWRRAREIAPGATLRR
jgi:hypothetical protein